MVGHVSMHPVPVSFVRTARAVPIGGRVPRDVPVSSRCMTLLREFAEDDAPVAVAFGVDPRMVVRRVGDDWYASYGAMGRDRVQGPHDLDWLLHTCSNVAGPHPFDGTSRSWTHSKRPDYAAAMPEDAFKEVEPVSEHMTRDVVDSIGALALVGGEILRQVREPVLELDDGGLSVHLFDVRDATPFIGGRRGDESLLERAPQRMFSLGDAAAIEGLGGRGPMDAAGIVFGPAASPPSLAPRAAASYLSYVHGMMRNTVADGDEAYFAAYRRLRATLCRLSGVPLDTPGAMTDLRAAVLDADDAVAAFQANWSRRAGETIVSRLETAHPDLAMARFGMG